MTESINLTQTAARGISSAIQTLHDLWTVLGAAGDTGNEVAACSVAHEMLPVIGGKLDAVIAALGEGRTGFFDGASSRQVISTELPDLARAEVRHG
jgi:hypothetical protein